MREYLSKTKRRIFKTAVEKMSRGADFKLSYSQTGEDVIVDFVFRYVLKEPSFTYFDIGAFHPTTLSNSALFYDRGLTGLCVEPDPMLYDHIRKKRPKDICLNAGIGFNEAKESEAMDFYIMTARTLNTFSKAEAERLDGEGTYKIREKRKIAVVHLHKLFEDYFVPDFLSLDVEGIDFQILKSIDLKKYRPKVICTETAEFSPVPPGKKEYESIDYLKENDYMVYADTFNNTVFIDNLHLQNLYSPK